MVLKTRSIEQLRRTTAKFYGGEGDPEDEDMGDLAGMWGLTADAPDRPGPPASRGALGLLLYRAPR